MRSISWMQSDRLASRAAFSLASFFNSLCYESARLPSLFRYCYHYVFAAAYCYFSQVIVTYSSCTLLSAFFHFLLRASTVSFSLRYCRSSRLLISSWQLVWDSLAACLAGITSLIVSMSLSTSFNYSVFRCLLFRQKRSKHSPKRACSLNASLPPGRPACAFPRLTCTPQLFPSRARIDRLCILSCDGYNPYNLRVISQRPSKWRMESASGGSAYLACESRSSILERVQEYTSSMRFASSIKTVSLPSACPSFTSLPCSESWSNSTNPHRLLILRVCVSVEVRTNSEILSLLFSSITRVNLSASCCRLPTGTLWAQSILFNLLKKSRMASSSAQRKPFTCRACRTAPPFLLVCDLPLLALEFRSSSLPSRSALSATTSLDSGMERRFHIEFLSSGLALRAFTICSQESLASSPTANVPLQADSSSVSTCLRGRQCLFLCWQVAFQDSSIIFLPQLVSSRTASSRTGSWLLANPSTGRESVSKRLRRYCWRVSNYQSHCGSI